MGKIIDDSVFELAVKLYNEVKISPEELADYLEVSVEEANKIIKKIERLGLNKNRANPEEQRKRVIELYKIKIFSLEKISFETGITEEMAMRFLVQGASLGLIEEQDMVNNKIVSDRIEKAIKRRKDDLAREQIQEFMETLSKNSTLEELDRVKAALIEQSLSINKTITYSQFEKLRNEYLRLGELEKAEELSREYSLNSVKRIEFYKKSEFQFQKAIELYNQGNMTKSAIAGELGISRLTLDRYIKKAEELGMINRHTILDDVVELYRNEDILTQEQIGEILDIHQNQVYRYLKRAREKGIISRALDETRKYIKEEKYEEALDMLGELEAYLQGESDNSKIEEIRKIIRKAIIKVGTMSSNPNFNNEQIRANRKRKFENNPKFLESIRLYEETELTQKEIADKVGISQSTVNYYIKEAKELGLVSNEPRKVKRQSRSKIESNPKFIEFVRLYNETEFTQKEIADKVGISLQTVNRYIKKAKELGLVSNEPRKVKRQSKREKIEQSKKVKLDQEKEKREIIFNEMLLQGIALIEKRNNKEINKYMVTLKKEIKERAKRGELTVQELGVIDDILININKKALGMIPLNFITSVVSEHIKLKDYRNAIYVLNQFTGNFQGTDRKEILTMKKKIKRAMDETNAYSMFLKGKSIEEVKYAVSSTKLLYIDFVSIKKKADADREKRSEEEPSEEIDI